MRRAAPGSLRLTLFATQRCVRPAPRNAGVLALLLLLGCAAASTEPPNLLLISVDTLRADHLSCYGGPPDVGTRICALADTGTRFVWAFSTAPYTAPSVASLLTSRYPSRHGVRQASGSALRREETSVAELLRKAGYTTAAFVSNPVLERFRNFRQGFEVYDVHMTRSERNRPARERDAVATTDAALAWAGRAPRRPWFLWVHFQDPHGPYEPPGAPPAHDPPGAIALPVHENESGLHGIPAYQALPGVFSRAAYEGRYFDEIRHVDAQVDRLVRGLDALGAPPAILFTSDHGEAFGEDGFYFSHGQSVGLDQIRVPLLWRPASPQRALVSARPATLLDVAPSLLAAAGVAIPATLEGRPLPLRDEPLDPRPIFAEHRQRLAVIVDGTYYSRDRKAHDPAPWYPARMARLPSDGATPETLYPPETDLPASLEAPLREFQRSSAAAPADTRVEVPPETRRRMRALGYVE